MFQGGLDCLNKADILTDIHSKTDIKSISTWKFSYINKFVDYIMRLIIL